MKALLAAIVDSSQDAIYAGDRDGTIISWNAGAERLYGYPAEEIIGRPLSLLYPPDGDAERARLMAAVNSGTPLTRIETFRRRKDGTIFPVALTVSPLRDANGEIVGASAIAQDITDRKRAEEALRLSESRFSTVFRQSPVALAVSEFDTGRFVEVNDALRQLMHAQSADQIVGHTSIDIGMVTADERRKIVEALTHPGHAHRLEIAMHRLDGEPFMSELSLSHYELGGVHYLLTNIVDVTERKRLEEERRRSDQQYRELVDGVRDVIFAVTPDGVITALNPAFEVITGATRAEWLGKPFVGLLHPDDVQEALKLVGAALRDEPRPLSQQRIRTARGDYVVAEFYLSPERRDGAIVRLLGIGRDVSERVRLEGQLRQAQKMEAIGLLAGGVAHDFNNLLATILSSSELLAVDFPANSLSREDLEAVQSAARRGAELTRNLLAFSRHQSLEMRVVSLGKLVTDFMRMAKRMLPEDVVVKLDVDPVDATIRADPGAVEQILMNLVTNARDAMPGGGHLLIAVTPVTLEQQDLRAAGETPAGAFARLAVNDTGTGMDAETLRRIFEPFFTTKPAGRGTGLGMPMVYGLAKQHGGFVEIESHLDRGTGVQVYFPIVTGEQAAAVLRAAPAARGGKETILLVEDDPHLRRVAVRTLERNGYTVLPVGDGREALNVVLRSGTPPDLIMTDIIMPEMSGPELLAELRKLGVARKVLFTSGYAPQDMGEQRQVEPGVPFLAKPWELRDLLHKVREVLDAPARQ